MARILVDSIWYNEVSIRSLYEYEFEALIKQQAKILFPDFHAVEFKPLISSPYGDGKPDLALIDKNYTNWWVVEVEKSNHSLDGHVINQIRKFSTADYNDEIAKYFKLENPDLDEAKLIDMMRGKQPKVLVVVDELKADWVSAFKRYDALLCVFQVFRSNSNRHIYRINGQSPISEINICSECYLDNFLKNYIVVCSPAVLLHPPLTIIEVAFNDTISSWKRLDISNKVYLAPVSQNPLDNKKTYYLYPKTDNTYYLTQKLL